MHLRTPTIVVAICMLLPGCLLGQAVDPSVSAIDPFVNVSVQDPDHQDSALLPGGSNAWNGQPTMWQMPPATAQKSSGGRVNQFPSLVGTSVWGTSSLSQASASNTGVVRARTSQAAVKLDLSRKLDRTLALVDLNAQKSSVSQDELALALAENSPTRTSAALELRKLRQDAAHSARSARVKIANPLQASADAASAGRWHSDETSIYALAQKEQNSDLLLRYGFGAQSKPRRHHRKTHTLGQHDW
jgi:hypothetical protein